VTVKRVRCFLLSRKEETKSVAKKVYVCVVCVCVCVCMCVCVCVVVCVCV